MADLNDKVVLVTGAGKGKGRALAEAFAAAGAVVAVNDISPVNLDLTVSRIRDAGGRVRDYIADIAKKMPVQALVQSVVEDWGRLDVLVNCAEVEPISPLLEMDDWDWQRTLDVNMTGAFLLTQIAGRVMKEQNGGIIVHVGARPKDSIGRSAYLTSKNGLSLFIEQVSQELAENSICLFFINPEEGNDIVSQVLSTVKSHI